MALGLYSSATFHATAPTNRQMFVTYFIFKTLEKNPAPGDMEMFELQQEGIQLRMGEKLGMILWKQYLD